MSFSALSVTFFLALGVSMDAFAVSISNGLCYGREGSTKKVALFSALTFGIFQGIMPLLGFLAGSLFQEVAESIDHWIALFLLSLIGGKMIWDGIQEMRNPEDCPALPFTFKGLMLQGVATSIDAFAVGIGLAMDKMNIWVISPVIAITTFVFSLIGVHVGCKFGKVVGDKAQIAGGLILIFIGAQIFVSHTFGMA